MVTGVLKSVTVTIALGAWEPVFISWTVPGVPTHLPTYPPGPTVPQCHKQPWELLSRNLNDYESFTPHVHVHRMGFLSCVQTLASSEVRNIYQVIFPGFGSKYPMRHKNKS
jgi:hypothetical protein